MRHLSVMLIAISLFFIPLAKASAATLKCINFYNHFGVERVLVFESDIVNSEHIPDALFIIDRDNVKLTVLESDEEDYTKLFETEDLVQVQARALKEAYVYEGADFLYALSFDRARATMNIRYVSGPDIVESSVDSSLCNID